jgi:IclR helix-turn-helix domain
MAGNPGTPGLKASSKTAAILLASTTGGEHTLSALANHTRLPASAVYQLLHDLASSPIMERTADGRARWPSLLSRPRWTCRAQPTTSRSGRR